MSRVVEPSREELKAKLRELYTRIGMAPSELHRRAREQSLEGEQWWLWDQIESLEFLLSDELTEQDADK